MSARANKEAKLSDLGEFGVIDLIKKQAGRPLRAIKGIGDDTAVMPFSSSKNLLFTTDMLL